MTARKISSDTVSKLTRELRQREAELAILNSVGEAMAKTLDVKTVTRIVGDKVRDIFSADQIGILLFEQQTSLLHLAYGYDKAHDRYADSIQVPLGKGLTSKVIESRQPLLLSTREEQDVHGHYMPPELKGLIKTSESWLGVPIMVDEEVLGVVMIEDYRPYVYNENHLHLLQILSSNMGVAIQNARLFDETQRLLKETEDRAAELAVINSVQAALAAELDLQGIYNAVGDKIRSIFHNTDVSIRIYDPKTNFIHYPYTYVKGQPFPLESAPLPEIGFSAHILRTRETLAINENMAQEMEKYNSNYFPGAGSTKSVIIVPLVSGDQARGLIALFDQEREHAFSDSDVRLLETLANSMSVALENARLFDETQRLLKETEDRAAELAVINSVQAALAAELDLQGIYNAVGDKIRSIFHNTDVSIRIYDPKTNFIHYPYTYVKGQPFPLESAPLPEIGFSAHILRTRETLVINENMAQAMEKYNSQYFPGAGSTKSVIIVPLVSGDQARGLIALFDQEREHAFSESDVRLLETLANSMSVALENARLFDETQRLLKETEQRNAELAIINSVQEGLASKLDFQEILELVGAKVREVFSADVIGFGLYDFKNNLIELPYILDHGERFTHEPRPIYGVFEYFLKSREPILLHTFEETEQFLEETGQNNVGGATQDNSQILVPMLSGGQVVGVVSVGKFPEYAFTELDVRLLQTLVNSMSVALENARLWEQEKKYRKALQRELEIGREIQAGFLPDALPLAEGWEIAASLMSAREVAGDFYDAFELPDGNIGLVIADVCDKGVGAALFMTLFRSLIRAAANLDYFEQTGQADAPHSVSERLRRAISLTNNYIAETHGDSGMFATLFFGILDPRDGRLTYINGGHEPPLIVQSGRVREALRKTGPAVGAVTNGRFGILETQLHAGDMFFAFTDGVPDCQNPRGEFFGHERLLDLLHSNGTAHEMVAAIESELRLYIASANQFDDITLLAVKRA
jgi:serine phosphatase RsbU (regulator of sigma subunit)/uncharacterized protein YigA (DUF484 family)